MALSGSARSSPRRQVVQLSPRASPRRARRSPRSSSPHRGQLPVQYSGHGQHENKQPHLPDLARLESKTDPPKRMDLRLQRLDKMALPPAPCDLALSARSLAAKSIRREAAGGRYPSWCPPTPRITVVKPEEEPLDEETKATETDRPQRELSRKSPSAALPVSQIHSPDFDSMKNLVSLAKRYTTSMAVVKRALEEFREADGNANGVLSVEEFKSAVRLKLEWDEEHEFPDDLLMTHWKIADTNGSVGIDFTEYLNWSICTQWSEQTLVPNPRDRILRKLSRDFCLPLPDVEYVRTVFDKYDIDRSDTIDEGEFKIMLCELIRANHRDVSNAFLKLYWTEVDKCQSGYVSFSQFVLWWFHVMVNA